ncbi:hypothetical protein ACFXCZ_23675 [Streptomyces sp. NPDC059396]|uniref:hypothetical protein n=1 Tax=Streptomyces sp. NPDC059396 TaxID=3346819 RepID=UPI00369C8B4F
MPCESAHDLPSFLELDRQLEVMRLLGTRNWKPARSIRLQLGELGDVVEAFYGLLGDKHWIFHDHLPLDSVRAILATAGEDADEAEKALIELYHSPRGCRS